MDRDSLFITYNSTKRILLIISIVDNKVNNKITSLQVYKTNTKKYL